MRLSWLGILSREDLHELRPQNECTPILSQLRPTAISMSVGRRMGSKSEPTRSFTSTIDGFACFRQRDKVPFFIYGETRTNRGSVASSISWIPENGSTNLCLRDRHISASLQKAYWERNQESRRESNMKGRTSWLSHLHNTFSATTSLRSSPLKTRPNPPLPM